jgi:hypothetical protein
MAGTTCARRLLPTVGVGIRAFDGYVYEMRDFPVTTHLSFITTKENCYGIPNPRNDINQ